MADDNEQVGGEDEELPPGPFVKIYGSIVYSSIWLEGAGTRLLWITMLAIADQDGNVRGSVRGLAATAKITPEECELGLAVLEAPDSDSQDKKFDGRRIRRMANGWHILNFRRYREMRTPEQVKTADRVRKHRERKQLHDVTGVTVTPEVEGEVEGELKPVVAVGDDVTRNVTEPWPADSALRLARMLNRGMGDNPQIGDAYNPIIATSGTTYEATERLQAAGVDLSFAEGWVYTFATAYKPKKLGDQISSLGYLVDAVIDAWQRATAKSDAAAAPRPAVTQSRNGATSGTSSPKASTNGTYTLRAGEIINLIRSYKPPAAPELAPDQASDFVEVNGRLQRIRAKEEWVAPPPAWRAELTPTEIRAVEAIGVDRITSATEASRGIVLGQLSKALDGAANG